MSYTENEIHYLKRQLENAEHYQLGYKRAKDTHYTKEDMVRMAIHCWNIASKPEYGKTYNVNEIAENYMKSLKQ